MRAPAFSVVSAALVAVAAITLVSSAALAGDPSKPHPHQGLLKPYSKRPPPLVLTDAERKTLDGGAPLMRQTPGENGGRALAVFRVSAPPDVVFATIGDYKNYPRFIPEVKKCEVYKRGPGTVDVAFTIKSFPVTIDYWIHHEVDAAARIVTWTLDYSKDSDLDDSVGFWRLTPIPTGTQVEYSVDIALKGFVPGFIRSILVDNGLKQATQWVKVQSEKRAAAAPAAPAAPAAAPAPPAAAPAAPAAAAAGETSP